MGLAPAAAWLLVACAPAPSGKDSGPTRAGVSKQAPGEPELFRGRVIGPGGRMFEVEVVQGDRERQQGLQYRTELAEDAGMLFLFPTAGRHPFWMYKCRIPLDIVWLDASRKVVYIGERLPICADLPCPDYIPDADSSYVLELGAGVAARSGIRVGTPLELLFSEPPNPI